MEDYHSHSVETINSHYNGKNGKNFFKRDKQEKHAELFRKDLISAMKMPDSENLQQDDYLKIADSWKGEWERGVQVPVNPNAFLPIFRVVNNYQEKENFDLFFLPKKLLHSLDQMNEFFKPPIHEPYSLLIQQQNQCGHDLDELDSEWLKIYNQSRDLTGEFHLGEDEMERVIEELEVQTRMMMTQKIDDIEKLGIEYDESVVCDVCRSPEGEEDNEMVFCDNCNICVHQACYGIQEIPDGSWLCRTCSINIKPKCLLCSQTGGAMKCTREGDKWAHISCALWIPEVSIGCPEKMEPITDLDLILPSRWSLVCVLCEQDSGACIQCSVKSCKVSFHVTCAFRHNLNLTTVIDDETEDVQMKAYCPVHSGVEVILPSGNSILSGVVVNAEDIVTQRKTKRHKEVFTEQMKNDKLRQIHEDFHLFPNLQDVSTNIDLPLDVVASVCAYWKLKRKSKFDKALIMMNDDEDEDEEKEDEVENEWLAGMMMKMRMFVQLRQDLERVRNLCYMVNKREKTSRRLFLYKEDIFNLQAHLYAYLVDQSPSHQDKPYLNNTKVGSDVIRMRSDEFKNSSLINSRLSDDSDDDRYDDDGGYRDSVIMTYKRDNSDYEEEDSGRHIRGFDDEDSDKEYKNGLIKREERRREEEEEMRCLMGAHKTSGSVYDDPTLVLSCSFHDDDHVDCRINRHLFKPSNRPLDLFSDDDVEKDLLEKASIVAAGGSGGVGNEKCGVGFGGYIDDREYKKERVGGERIYHRCINDKDPHYSTKNRANHSKKHFDDDYLVDSLGEDDVDTKEDSAYSKTTKAESKSHEWSKNRKQVGKGTKGKPKKRRGRPPKVLSPVRSPSSNNDDNDDDEVEGFDDVEDDDEDGGEREDVRLEFEDDDSDYYQRLNDEDCEKDLLAEVPKKGVVGGKAKGGKRGYKGRKQVEVGVENSAKAAVVEIEKKMKKRGRKRKSELLSFENVDDKNSENNAFSIKILPADAPKKRKYTRKVGRKKNNNNLRNKNNTKDTKSVNQITKSPLSVSPPPSPSSSASSPSIHTMFTKNMDDDDRVDNVEDQVLNRRNRIISFDSDDDVAVLKKAGSGDEKEKEKKEKELRRNDDDSENKNDVCDVGDEYSRKNVKRKKRTVKKGVLREKLSSDENLQDKVNSVRCESENAAMKTTVTNLTTEMLFSSDSDKEEGEEMVVSKLLSRGKKKHSSKTGSSTSILLHDLELSDSNDDGGGCEGDDDYGKNKVIDDVRLKKSDEVMEVENKLEVGLTDQKDEYGGDDDNNVRRIGDSVSANDDVIVSEKKNEEAEIKRVESPTLIYPPVTKVASLFSQLPESHHTSSSSDEDDDDDDDGGDIFSTKGINGSIEKPKSDSKKTGVKKQEVLNAKVKEILLHQLPTKEFIVSSHLKSLVRDYFCAFGNPEKSDCRFTFNGFKMPQGKINCI